MKTKKCKCVYPVVEISLAKLNEILMFQLQAKESIKKMDELKEINELRISKLKKQMTRKTNKINTQYDEDIINIMSSILRDSHFVIETINESVLVKLMELRGTPIKYDESVRDMDGDFDLWKNYLK